MVDGAGRGGFCTEPFWNAIKRSTVKHDAAAAAAAAAAAVVVAVAATASLLRNPCYVLSPLAFLLLPRSTCRCSLPRTRMP